MLIIAHTTQGVSITAASGASDDGTATYSGTSMSSPHVVSTLHAFFL